MYVKKHVHNVQNVNKRKTSHMYTGALCSHLKRHMLIHTGDKQHVCPECDKRFTQAGTLKKHMLIHTGEKQHVCPECDKRFTRAADLKKHMLIHTGEKQHASPKCDKRFA